jgi:serine/threonine-protein kinase
VDRRSDIFSLGVLLYEMLTGIPPFRGENISAIMYRILNEMPMAPATLKPELPEAFDYIVAKALAKHPDDRYQRADEMAADLRNYQTLQTPLNFHSGSDGSARTLERRKTPRPLDEQTLLMTSAAPLGAGNPWWKRHFALWGGAVFLMLGIFLLSWEKPGLKEQPQITNVKPAVLPEKPELPLPPIPPRATTFISP